MILYFLKCFMSNSNIVDNEEIKSSVKNLEDSMIDYLDYEDEDDE